MRLLEILLIIANILAGVFFFVISAVMFGFCGDAGEQECSRQSKAIALFFAFQLILIILLIILFNLGKSRKPAKYLFWLLGVTNLLGVVGMSVPIQNPVTNLYVVFFLQ